jgi:endoplasmic reticulum protein 29
LGFRSKSEVYIGLPGCLKEFDTLANKFMNTKCPEKKKNLLKQAEQLWDKAEGNRENKSAETYVKVIRNIHLFCIVYIL